MPSFFAVAKQSVLEKVGKAEKTVDSPEMSDALLRWKGVENQTLSLKTHAGSWEAALKLSAASGLRYGNLLKEIATEDGGAEKVTLEQLAAHHGSVEQSKSQIASDLATLVTTLTNFYNEESAAASELLKKYQRARIEYDIAKSDFADLAVKRPGQDKLQPLEDKMEAAKQNFEKAAQDFVTHVDGLEFRRRKSVLLPLHHFSQAEARHYQALDREGMLFKAERNAA